MFIVICIGLRDLILVGLYRILTIYGTGGIFNVLVFMHCLYIYLFIYIFFNRFIYVYIFFL